MQSHPPSAPMLQRSRDLGPLRPSTTLLWLLLPACASVLLLATTNKLCQDVAVIPFLWVLPLALYLLSFIICFDNPRWYARFPFTLALIARLGGLCWALFKASRPVPLQQVAVYSGGLFVCCMVCHGELYRLRPDSAPSDRLLPDDRRRRRAGRAARGRGRAAGFHGLLRIAMGLFCCAACCSRSFVRRGRSLERKPISGSGWRACCRSPRSPASTGRWRGWAAHYTTLPKGHGVFSAFGSACGGCWFWWWRPGMRENGSERSALALRGARWLSLGLVALGVALWAAGAGSPAGMPWFTGRAISTVCSPCSNTARDAEGPLFPAPARAHHARPSIRRSGPVRVADDLLRRKSGVGLAVRALPAGARRIGLVGLGTGTMAAYGRAGDYVRIYEINPEVQTARHVAVYLPAQMSGKVEVVLGDARLSMEREPPQQFDLLALDAFSSDAIPVHLLTREAFEIYERHMKPDGIIAVHISNRYLDLEPVVVNLARHSTTSWPLSYDENDEEWWVYSSTWMLLTRNDEDPQIVRHPRGHHRREH